MRTFKSDAEQEGKLSVEEYFYAHTIAGQPPEKWQFLEVHLREVAKLAAEFASAYDAADWAYCAGLWHDVGKYQREFQERLRGSGLSVEHSGAGAYNADRYFVAPHAGAWIETTHGLVRKIAPNVAPHAGAWIETEPPAPLPARP